MKKFYKFVSTLLIAIVVLSTFAPFVTHAVNVNCGGTVVNLPSGEGCSNDPAWFVCVAAAGAAALAAATALFWWNPPLLFITMTAMWTAAVILCRQNFPNISDLIPDTPVVPTLTAGVAWNGSLRIDNPAVGKAGSFTNRVYFDKNRDGWKGEGVAGDFSVQKTVNSLAAQSSTNISVPYTFAVSQIGSWRVRVDVDTANKVKEVKENNNSSAWRNFVVNAAAIPDLVPVNLVQSGTLTMGQNVTFTGNMRTNNGAAGASAARFCIDNPTCLDNGAGILGTDEPLGPQSANTTSGPFSRTWIATPGLHHIYFCTDVNKTVIESNEANNCVSLAQFRVTAPNLTSNPGASASYQMGTSNTINLTVNNTGDNTTGGGFTTSMYFDFGRNAGSVSCPPAVGNANDFCRTVNSASLAANSPIGLTIPNVVFPVKGNWRARTTADSANAIIESNEADNSSSWSDFAVDAQPDLRVVSLSIPSGALTTGQSLTFTGRIQNQGNDSSLISAARFCIDDGNCPTSIANIIGTALSIPPLDPNDFSGPHSRSWTATAGIHTIHFCAIGGTCMSSPFTVNAPVVIPPSIPTLTVDKETAQINEPITFTWDTLTNDPLLCTLTGPGSTKSTLGSMTTAQGSMIVNLQGASRYTLTCPGGIDFIDMKLRPGIWES